MRMFDVYIPIKYMIYRDLGDIIQVTTLSNTYTIYIKSYRCPKLDGDAKQTLEIRVERKRNNPI